MTTSARIVIYFSLLVSFFILIPQFVFIYAATFSLSPTNTAVQATNTFQLNLKLDTQGENIKGADAAIRFDPTYIEPVSVVEPAWFPLLLANIPTTSDILYVRGSVTDPADKRNGNNLMTTITFRAKKAGTTTVSFLCQSGNGNDTNIWDTNINDIADCLQITGNTYTITIAQPPTPTPAPTGEPTCDLCGKCKNKSGNGLAPESWQMCRTCIYNNDGSKKIGTAWTPLGCIPTQPAPFVLTVLNFIVKIAGGIAFLIILYGGFMLVTSRGNYEGVNAGRRLIVGAIASLLLLVFAIFILRFIGVNILGIPGFS